MCPARSRVEVRLEYVELNDSDSFDVVGGGETKADYGTRPALLSGALWVGKTRLIDNLILRVARPRSVGNSQPL